MKLILNNNSASQLQLLSFTRTLDMNETGSDGLFTFNCDVPRGEDVLTFLAPYVNQPITSVKVVNENNETLSLANNIQAMLTNFSEQISEEWYNCSINITVYTVTEQE